MIEAEPWSYHVDGSPVYSLADIIRKRSAITPQGIALTEAGRTTSFAELDQRSSQVARALQRKDVRPGDRVAYIGASGPEFAEVMYGAAKCRAIFTAVNNRLSAREVLAILADAEPRVVIVDPPAAPLVADVGTLGLDCDSLITDLDYLAWRDYAPADDPGEMAEPDETALILYTSGTTGVPKGVELTGRNLGCALHELHASIELDEGSVCAAPVPFFHMAFDADGFLYLHDRLKDMIVTGGENVYPAEVESVMTGHPAVAEVAVVGVPSAEWGESPYAVVVLRPGVGVSETELVAWTRDRLARFKCPVGVSFLPSLARTASGKLQKQAIRASLGSVAVP
jgi:acyl-CoA synthetase (AMP-forming)/AMP-acid ligase II